MITDIQLIETEAEKYEKLSFDQSSCNIEEIKHLNKAKCVQYNYLENTILCHIYICKKQPHQNDVHEKYLTVKCAVMIQRVSKIIHISYLFILYFLAINVCLWTYLIRVKTRLIKNIEYSNVLSSTNIFSLSIQNLNYLNGSWLFCI